MRRLLSAAERLIERPSLALAAGAAVLALLTLAALFQYRWIGEVSEAERQRLRAVLRDSTARFAQDFNGEIARLVQFLHQGPPLNDPQEFADRFARWTESTLSPKLVRDLYLTRRGLDEVLRLAHPAGRFEPASWPQHFAPLRARLDSRTRSGPRPGMPLLAVTIDEQIAAFASPLTDSLPGRFLPPSERPPASAPMIQGWLITELNLDFLRRQYFPALVDRYFGRDYYVEILRRADPTNPLYRSDSGFSITPATADATAPLLDFRPQGGFGPPPFRPGPGRPGGRLEGRPGRAVQPSDADSGPDPPGGRLAGPGPWELLVQHRSGSLDAVVDRVRRRNLAVSFAVFLVLALSLAMLLFAARRAQRLARLELDFVAGVSHELRTPLAVIRSAGENLADGVIAAPDQLRRYGALIRDEGRRLTEMVEQILGFAGLQSGRARFDLQPVDLPPLLDRAVEACQSEITASGCQLEMHLDPDLPAVLADPTALTHCLRNLLSNAAKHAAQGRWIGLQARRAGPEVHLIVEDRGPGIDPTDLPHVFDPFYRGRRALSDQVHGSGLGLALVRRILEAHGGKVEVSSRPGRGARFVLRLPISCPTASS